MKKIIPKLNPPQLLVLLLAVLIAFGQLQKLSFMGSQGIFGHDILIGCVLLGFFLFSRNWRTYFTQKVAALNCPFQAFVIWVSIGLAVAVFAGHFQMTGLLYLLRIVAYWSFGWWLEFQVTERQLTPRFILSAFLLSGLGIAYFGWLQYFFLPDTRFLFWLGWDDHYYRLLSTLLDPGFTGLTLVLTLILGQAWITTVKTKHQKWLELGLFLFVVPALLLTYSRASYLAFVVAEVAVLVLRWREKKFHLLLKTGAIILAFLVAIPFLPKPGGEGSNLARVSTITARTSATQEVLARFRPLTWMVGDGLFQSSKPTTQSPYLVSSHAQIPDNWLIFLLQGTGILGLILGILAIVISLSRNWQLNPWLVAGGVSVLTHSLFAASIVYPFTILFVVALGMSSTKFLTREK